jgi:Cyclic nucleotide-binding domain/HEAT repeats
MPRSLSARLAPAAAFQFCFIASVAMLKPGANALTLSRFNAGALPYLYMAAALIAALLALLGGEGRKRRDPGYLALVGAVIAVGLAVGVRFELPMVALGAYLFSEAFATQVSLSFWSQMGDAFDAREARRAFSWVNGVGMSGAIVGGLIAQVLARTAGALALLIGGGVFLMGAGIAWRLHRVDVEVAPSSKPRVTVRAGWREVLTSPYTQLLGVMVLSVLQQLTDFIFREHASTLNEAGMADLFASHQLWTGVFCVLFQFALAEVLLRKLGILKYAAIVPTTIAALTIAAWAVPSVWSAWALKVFEAASSWSLMPVAIQLMYAPLGDEVRDGARRTIDGLVRKGGMAFAGVLILGLAAAVGLNGVFVLSLSTCALVAWSLWKIRPRYVEAVHTRVAGLDAQGQFDGEERVLTEAIKSPSPEQALRAADLLERTGLMQEPQVRLLLAHPQERVQERGVALTESMGLSGLAKQLEALIVSGARRPRDSAIGALAKIAPERARVVLPPLLAQSDIGVLTATIGGLLSLPGPEDVAARRMLDGLLKRGVDGPPAERREVARLLGRVGKTELARYLVAYLDDSDVTVRRVAIEATGAGKYLELAPRLLRFLSWRDERRVARQALATLGDLVVPLIGATLDDRSRARSLRLQLPRVLRLIATQSAFDALLFSNAYDDPSLHYRVGIALAQLHDEHPHLTVDEARQLDSLGRRRDVSDALVEPYRDCRAALGEDSLLTRVLGDRLDQAMELSFWLLGLRHDARGLRRAHALLIGPDARRRAWAMELVDNVLTTEERELVSHYVEAHHRSLPFGAAARLEAHLPGLCASEDFILKACARAVARRLGLWNLPHREDDMNEIIVKRLFALEGVEIFARSDVDDLAAVATVAKELTFAKGARVYSEGDPGDALYVIIEGSMEARRDGETVLTMKAKESFGETSLFDGAPRVNDVVAMENSRALVIDRRDFLDLLADRPELLAGMFRVLSRQLKSMVVEVANRRSTGEMQAVGGPPVR